MKHLISILFAAVFPILTAQACNGNNPEPDYSFPSTSAGEEPGDTDEPGDADDPINTYFPGEIRPAEEAACFAGAYYHKCVSSTDYWLGIGGTVVLPNMVFDPERTNPNKPGQYLDNPSVYLGGNMGGQETDIGLTWEVVRLENGSVSAERKAFRPFMRRTGQEPTYSNAPAEDRYYWYPGEEVTISIRIIRDGVLEFIVDGAGKQFKTEYECNKYLPGEKGEFKRVNAIDQVSNEGKPVQATETVIEGAEWKASWLYREYEGEVVKAPMHTGRYTDMRCPDAQYFKIEATDEEKKAGAEKITINGAGY